MARGRGPFGKRADGRTFTLLPGSDGDEVGRYVLPWAEFPCDETESCKPPRDHPRGLLVTGVAAPGDPSGREQVLQVMRDIAISVRAITNALVPPPAPTVPAGTKVLLGKGGTGKGVWEAWIRPLDGNPGFAMDFPRAAPEPPGSHWEQLEPQALQRDGVYTQMDCLSWTPGSGLLLSGLAHEDTETVRIELAGQPPTLVPTFGREKPIPWVAFVSPPVPPGSKLDRVVALDAAGNALGTRTRPFEDHVLCQRQSK